MVSFAHMVAARGFYVAIVSTTVETRNPLGELEPGINLLGNILERFDNVADIYEPLSDGLSDRCFISKSYDATRYDILSQMRGILRFSHRTRREFRTEADYVCVRVCCFLFFLSFFLALLLCNSHFETAANDVLSLYERLTGQQLDMNISADTTDADA